HFYAIKHESLGAKKGCALRVEHVSGHVIGVRPHAQLRIIEKVTGQMKIVSVPSASCVACLGNGDAFVLRNTSATWRCELTNDPAIGYLIIHYDGITIPTVLTGASKARPN